MDVRQASCGEIFDVSTYLLIIYFMGCLVVLKRKGGEEPHPILFSRVQIFVEVGEFTI